MCYVILSFNVKCSRCGQPLSNYEQDAKYEEKEEGKQYKNICWNCWNKLF